MYEQLMGLIIQPMWLIRGCNLWGKRRKAPVFVGVTCTAKQLNRSNNNRIECVQDFEFGFSFEFTFVHASVGARSMSIVRCTYSVTDTLLLVMKIVLAKITSENFSEYALIGMIYMMLMKESQFRSSSRACYCPKAPAMFLWPGRFLRRLESCQLAEGERGMSWLLSNNKDSYKSEWVESMSDHFPWN
jgi:hypothetical protein